MEGPALVDGVPPPSAASGGAPVLPCFVAAKMAAPIAAARLIFARMSEMLDVSGGENALNRDLL